MPRTPPPVRTAPPATGLRRRYERTCSLDVAGQLRELVDYLENPEVLVAEYNDAWCAVDSCAVPDDLVFVAPAHAAVDWPALGAVMECATTPPCRQTVVATAVPLLAPVADAPCSGLDYSALPTGESARGAIGVIQTERDTTPFALLLRALAAVTELGPDAQWQAAADPLFKGALGADPSFELQLVLTGSESESEGGSDHGTLRELTRDLAERFREGIADEWHIPERIGSITCLRLAQRPRLEPLWIA